MPSHKVNICEMDTSTLPLIKSGEVLPLISKAHAGDQQARQALIRGNLRLVLSVIQRFYNKGEDLDDLFQIGCIGLMKAIDNFNENFNVKFSTYAVPMIIGEIRRYLRDNNALRVSRSIRDTAYKVLKERDNLTVANNREPTVSDIASALGIGEEDVVLALSAIQDPVSLFDPLYQDSGDAVYVIDQIRDERVSEEGWIRDISLKTAIDALSDREKRIIRARYFSGKTQMEIAGEIGISQAQVSRLEKTALNVMKRRLV